MSSKFRPIIELAPAVAGCDVTFQRRITANGATGIDVPNEWKALKQADISTITCAVYNLDAETPGTPIDTPSVVVGTAISDSLVVDDRWTDKNGQPVDSIGRNFLHTVAGATYKNNSDAPIRYRTLYTVNLTGGSELVFGFDMPVVNPFPVVPAGVGSISWTLITQDGSGNPIEGVSVLVTSDSAGAVTVAGPLLTDGNGEVELNLNAGTYYQWRTLAGYTFTNPQSFVVS